MSQYFTGGTFAYQKVLPSEDAAVRRAVIPDGVLFGCALSYSGTTLTMGAGLLFICGRVVRHPLEQHWTINGASSGYARLVLTVDISRTATADEFDQVTAAVDYATSIAGFGALVQEDINNGGAKYQMAACVVSLGSGGITGIVQVAPTLAGLQSYAPAGYGLGLDEAPEISSLAQLDNLTKSGFYRLNIQSGSASIGNVSFAKATVFVRGYDATAADQTVTLVGSNTRAVRAKINGAWKPWCIENPPMSLGLEYRTAEYWGGSAIYTKRISYTPESFSQQLITLPHGVSGLKVCISADVLWKRTDQTADGWRHLPASDYYTADYDGQVEYVNAKNIAFRLGGSLQSKMKRSAEPVYVTLRYTKD